MLYVTGEMNTQLAAVTPISPNWGNMATETRDKDGVLDAREAGKFLRDILEERGMQIQQLAEKTTVPDPDYLSNLLSGRVNVGKSKHFPSIARALGLNAEDVAYINPNLFVQVTSYGNGAPIPPVVRHADPLGHIHVPQELEAALSKYGAALGIPKNIDLRHYIPRFEAGTGPETEEDWQDWLMDNRRWLKGG